MGRHEGGGWLDGQMRGWADGRTGRRMDGRTGNGRMGGREDRWMGGRGDMRVGGREDVASSCVALRVDDWICGRQMCALMGGRVDGCWLNLSRVTSTCT